MSNAEISVLSAGAVQPGMVKVIDAFRHETGHEVKIAFATAPAILKRVDGETPDVVIAPPAVLDELCKVGKATPTDHVTIGRIGVGLMVRDGVPLPMIGTIEEFNQSLLTAKSVVYNQASTGIYLEKSIRASGNRGTLENQDCAVPGRRSRSRTHLQRQERRNRLRRNHCHHRGRKQRSQVRRAVTARNPKLHGLRRGRPNQQGPLRRQRGSSSASSPGRWHEKFLRQQASNKRRNHADVFPKEISLHLVSSRCVVSLQLGRRPPRAV